MFRRLRRCAGPPIPQGGARAHDRNIRASQEYEGTAWAAYNTAYRRQAAARGQTDWSRINPSLYAIATHKADDCSLTSEADPDVATHLKAIESAVVALTRPVPAGPTKPRDRERLGEACRNWNRNRNARGTLTRSPWDRPVTPPNLRGNVQACLTSGRATRPTYRAGQRALPT